MSEYQQKKSSFKKTSGNKSGRGRNAEYPAKGNNRKKDTFRDEKREDIREEKSFGKRSKPGNFSKTERKSTDLVPKIKKSFKKYEEDKITDFKDKREQKKDFKTKKSYFKEEEASKTEKSFKRSYKNKDSKPFKKSAERKTGYKKTKDREGFEGEMRLNRYIAASGICSRREADDLIKLGEVKVNGVVVTEMGTKVNPTDKVDVGGEVINPEKKVYILLNKPKDFVSTVSDPNAERTVLDLVKPAGAERIYPVGRLDKNTTGVMLLTNDGDLTKKLTHPGYKKKKVYHVVLDKPATKAILNQIAEGFELEDGFINADAVSFVKEGDRTEIGIELHSGRNRIVRRIFEHLGFNVVKLDRVYFAGLTKKNVPRGKWRFLTDKEVAILKRGAYE